MIVRLEAKKGRRIDRMEIRIKTVWDDAALKKALKEELAKLPNRKRKLNWKAKGLDYDR